MESIVSVGRRDVACRQRRQPDRYGHSNACIGHNIEDNSEISLDEALKGPEKEQRLEAVRDELQCFDSNNAWELVDMPRDKTIVQCRWVLRKKCDILLELHVTHLDVKTAFLNGDLEETIYMQKTDYYNVADCKAVDTPMESKLSVKDKQNINNQVPYQQLIGSLMYLSVLTRPDITYAVSYLSQFDHCHTSEHWGYAKRVLKYLKGTINYGIKYCANGSSEIKGFVDADWANNRLDRRSYTGFCFVLANGIISWQCKKQKTVALSSCEAKHMAISESCKEAIYLRALQFEITNKIYRLCLYNDREHRSCQ
ncbi:uncharacterized protein [Battus philenor]|uniref:uncharacterized protein n=1 Tax=Battus philenor TaxID=42288 RepID=UPI0035D019AA